MKRLFVGTVRKKREEVLGWNSPTKKVLKRLLVRTVPPKNSEEVIGRYRSTKKNSEAVIGRYSPTIKIVKRLLVGTVPQKNSEEVIGRYSPTKK